MNQAVLRWGLRAVRYGLLAFAVFYLYHNVNWHDYVVLADGSDARLLKETPDGYRVLLDGEPALIGPEAVQSIEVDGQLVAKIKYGVAGVVQAANFRLAAAAIILFAPVPFLSAVRLVWMLGIQDVRLSIWNAVKLTFAGNFFNFALPGTTGGDLIKAYYVTRFTHHKTEAVTTIFLDRVVGLLGLMFVASLMFLIGWQQIEWNPPSFRNYLAAVLAAIWGGLLVASLFVFSKRLRHLIRLPSLAERLPAGEHLLRIGRATVAMRYHKSLLVGSLVITIVLQLLVIFSAYFMARALNMQGSFALYFVCVPIGFLIAAIPIAPPQGFGVMEGAYVMFFTQGGLNPKSAAFAFALANRLSQLVWAIPGLLVPLLGAHLPSKRELAEMEDASREDLSPPHDESPADSPLDADPHARRAAAAGGATPSDNGPRGLAAPSNS